MKLECTQHSTYKKTSKNNHQPQSQPEEAYFEAGVTDTTEFRVTLKICLKTQTRVSRIVPAVSCRTLWFCPWTTRRPPRWAGEDRVQNNLVKKAQRMNGKALANTWNRARADRFPFFAGESIVLCRWPRFEWEERIQFLPRTLRLSEDRLWLTAQRCTAPAAS